MSDLSAYLHALPAGAGGGAAPPPRFTYPFYYRPHPLALAAAADLQEYLPTQQEWEYDFGLASERPTGGRGKMFGVLVVRSAEGSLGYLAAYSGKLADSNHLPGFVPPVFDLLVPDGFYKAGEIEVHELTLRIESLRESPEYREATAAHTAILARMEAELAAERKKVKEGKQRRKVQRTAARDLSTVDLQKLEEKLREESIRESFGLKDMRCMMSFQAEQKKKTLDEYNCILQYLLDARASLSASLQERIFEQYTFLDAMGKDRSLGSIFRETVLGIPPAGAGECAAPKLLQFAYRRGLKPLALAEFWWGESPSSAIRKHGHFYPACRGKCEPILGHMLQGLPTDPNPLLKNPGADTTIYVIYEDDAILVIDKPADLLSVPGKRIGDSVQRRIRARYPEATGPLIVHRLDMSTSGLLLLAKTKEAHKLLQRQFFKRSVSKRYVAILEGQVSGNSGTIDLPLRGDLEDRPRQIVCRTHGKSARSHWEVVARTAQTTTVHFWPVTGRTHQLRVHAAHPEGLNAPIVGDDLYGQPGDRLHLHAELLEFTHPVTKQALSFIVPAPFAPAYSPT
ncbi:pseudouridine synthase [Neolewinella sp.]|uniref:RluA family pseudouridine synthase n=1 Tax=Neolewinella sp. TaxID=2993543 RepID=UPI003B51C926